MKDLKGSTLCEQEAIQCISSEIQTNMALLHKLDPNTMGQIMQTIGVQQNDLNQWIDNVSDEIQQSR